MISNCNVPEWCRHKAYNVITIKVFIKKKKRANENLKSCEHIKERLIIFGIRVSLQFCNYDQGFTVNFKRHS